MPVRGPELEPELEHLGVSVPILLRRFELFEPTESPLGLMALAHLAEHQELECQLTAKPVRLCMSKERASCWLLWVSTRLRV